MFVDNADGDDSGMTSEVDAEQVNGDVVAFTKVDLEGHELKAVAVFKDFVDKFIFLKVAKLICDALAVDDFPK